MLVGAQLRVGGGTPVERRFHHDGLAGNLALRLGAGDHPGLHAELYRLLVKEGRFVVRSGEGDDSGGVGREHFTVASRNGSPVVLVLVLGIEGALRDILVFGPFGADLLDAPGAAVEEDHVRVLGVDRVEGREDRGVVRAVLVAGDRDTGALGQILAVAERGLRAAVVAGIDAARDRGRLADMRAGGGLPGLAAFLEIGAAAEVADDFVDVAHPRQREVALGLAFELLGGDVPALLLDGVGVGSLGLADVLLERGHGAFDALDLEVEDVDEAVEKRLALRGHLVAVGGDGFRDQLDRLGEALEEPGSDFGRGLALLQQVIGRHEPEFARIGFAGCRSGAVERRLLGDHAGHADVVRFGDLGGGGKLLERELGIGRDAFELLEERFVDEALGSHDVAHPGEVVEPIEDPRMGSRELEEAADYPAEAYFELVALPRFRKKALKSVGYFGDAGLESRFDRCGPGP